LASVLRAFGSPAAESTRWTQLQAVFYWPAPWPPSGPEDCGVAEGFPGAIRGPPDAACGPAALAAAQERGHNRDLWQTAQDLAEELAGTDHLCYLAVAAAHRAAEG